MQPVPFAARRCPNCYQPLHSGLWITLCIGAGGLLALVFVIVVMYLTIRKAEVDSAAPPAEQSSIVLAVNPDC